MHELEVRNPEENVQVLASIQISKIPSSNQTEGTRYRCFLFCLDLSVSHVKVICKAQAYLFQLLCSL